MTTAETLTPRQQQVLEIIERHTKQKGYPPSMREIGKALGIKSLNGVTWHLEALERKGVIRRQKHASRGITIIDNQRFKGLPFGVEVGETVLYNVT